MSYSLSVHLKLNANGNSKVNQLLTVLECLSLFDLPKESDPQFFRYTYAEVVSQSFKNADKVQLNTSSTKKVAQFLNNRWDEQGCISVKSIYPCYHYDNKTDSIIKSVTCLDITLYGDEYANGYYWKKYGDLMLVFDNVNTFFVPHLLIKKANDASIFSDKLRFSSIVADLKSNYKDVIEIMRLIIGEIYPKHLIICTTDTEVSPLTAHELYHEDIQDFAVDLHKIVYFHKFGGAYFDTKITQGRGKPTMLTLAPNYGYLRKQSEKQEKKFIEQVDLLVSEVLESSETLLLDKDIENCLQNAPNTKVEKIGASYLVSAFGSPFSYIDSLYISLVNSVAERC